jgi:ABC-type transport system involved in multi-copper enzyme maturation permease subunit
VEIILGKLLARMAQVGLLIIAGLPVLCFIGVWAGLHPPMMLAVFLVTVAPVFALAAAALLASVWARQTRDAVLGLYAVAGGVLLLAWIIHRLADYLAAGVPAGAAPGLLLTLLDTITGLGQFFNPIYVLAPGWETGSMRGVALRLLGSIAAWGGVGGVCLALAVWRLRGAYLRQLESSGKRQDGGDTVRVVRAAVGEEPIRWKEREVEGIAPLAPLRRIPSALGVLLVALITILSSLCLLGWSIKPGVTLSYVTDRLTRFDLIGAAASIDTSLSGPYFLTQSCIAMLLASLIVGIRCSGAVSGERERQTWEALLLTPLEAKQLIRGKLWGICGAALPYLAAYAAPAIVLSIFGGFLAFVSTLLCLCVTLLAMWYIGAAGIFCSVRSRSSWRALLGTVAFGYLVGFVLYVVTQPVIWIVAGILFIFLKLIDDVYQLGLISSTGWFGDFTAAFFIATCIGLAAIFYGMAWWFIADAEKRVADKERTRHWKEEPSYPRQRQRVPVSIGRRV